MTQTSTELPRDRYIALLHAGLRADQPHFVRQAAVDWLGRYPGDLEASYLHAQALVAEQRPKPAVDILESVCRADPEFVSAAQTRIRAKSSAGGRAAYDLDLVESAWYALAPVEPKQPPRHPWAKPLRTARLTFAAGDLEGASTSIQDCLSFDPPTPLAAATHLRLLAAQPETPLQARLSLARYYRQRWPDCLAVLLLLGHWLLDAGQNEVGVKILHTAAGQDVGGQVAYRLWGDENPYRSLWPDSLHAPLDVAVPAPLAAYLGLNRLTDGLTHPAAVHPAVPEQPTDPVTSQQEEVEPVESFQTLEPFEMEQPVKPQIGSKLKLRLDIPSLPIKPFSPSETGQGRPDRESVVSSSSNTAPPSPQDSQGPNVNKPNYRHLPAELRPVRKALDQVGQNLGHPDLSQGDGRFPVYVVCSLRRRLESHFGRLAADSIVEEMIGLVKAVSETSGWLGRLFLADDPDSVKPFGLAPIKSGDPWDLKLALGDLDAALEKQGLRIGALLIVGGPKIVPFHRLPNPVDDPDPKVPSDNPYGTRDENYFITEWPVGRLPDGGLKDPEYLLNALRRSRNYHVSGGAKQALPTRLAGNLLDWLWRLNLSTLPETIWPGPRPSLGFTAAVWESASAHVYEPIGAPRRLQISPPLHRNGRAVNLPTARLGYFNLHGVDDGGDWYGQSLLEDGDELLAGPDYPVVLSPKDILSGGKSSRSVPAVIFSEACYGGQIEGKEPSDSMALAFLAAGAQAVVGSTGMSYGAVKTPLIAADILGLAFWRLLRRGLPVGEALRRARIQLARQMDARQGYLDGTEQKTLTSFILYGDPLARPAAAMPMPKSLQQPPPLPSGLRTVCDRACVESAAQPLSPEAMAHVKSVVARYLPGMANANMVVGSTCPGCPDSCSKKDDGAKILEAKLAGRKNVTLSKQVEDANVHHRHYARLTLDGDDRIVKLSVSR